MRIINAILFFISHIQNAWAEVNLFDASFCKTWTDHKIVRDRRDFKIRRAYNSRSLHHGLFGFAWCSDFERKLVFDNKKVIRIENCSQTENRYQKEDETFTSIDGKNDIIIKTLKSYIRRVYGRVVEIYDLEGRLRQSSAKGQLAYDIFYNKNSLPIQLVLSTGQIIKINYNESQQISQLTLPESIILSYTYLNANLIQVNKNKNTQFKYTYDNVSNLTSTVDSRGKIEKQEYDSHNDRVIRTVEINGCQENYTYLSKTLNSNFDQQISTLNRTCPNQLLLQKQFIFWIKKPSHGLPFVEKVNITANETMSELSYSEFSFYPTSVKIRSPSRVTAFEDSKLNKKDIYEYQVPN